MGTINQQPCKECKGKKIIVTINEFEFYSENICNRCNGTGEEPDWIPGWTGDD